MAATALWKFCCDKTTEHGEDEVYILIAGKLSNGQTFSHRLPNSSGHWNMNDGQDDENHCIHGVTLADFTLNQGESADIMVIIMEEDGGTTKPYQQALAALLAESGDPHAIAAATVLGILTHFGFFGVDSDDYIGTVSIRMVNENGHLTTHWHAIDRVSYQNVDVHGSNSCEFRFNGDGSDYVGWFHAGL